MTNREYQLRAVLNSSDVDQLRYLVLGTAGDGSPVLLKDVGYVQVGYDLRRGTADLDGTGVDDLVIGAPGAGAAKTAAGAGEPGGDAPRRGPSKVGSESEAIRASPSSGTKASAARVERGMARGCRWSSGPTRPGPVTCARARSVPASRCGSEIDRGNA